MTSSVTNPRAVSWKWSARASAAKVSSRSYHSSHYLLSRRNSLSGCIREASGSSVGARLFPKIRRSHRIVLGLFGLAPFEVGLAAMGGFSGISACGQIALLEEVAPTRMVVRRALPLLEIFQGCLCGAPAVHHGDDAARTVRSDIVQNDCEGGAGIVVCQKKSVHNSRRSGKTCNQKVPYAQALASAGKAKRRFRLKSPFSNLRLRLPARSRLASPWVLW
jgi:hypothetical protein